VQQINNGKCILLGNYITSKVDKPLEVYHQNYVIYQIIK